MKTNGCAKYEERLARYAHGEILRQEREALESHLAGCASCESLRLEAAEADRILRALARNEVEFPPWLHARIMASLPEDVRASAFARWSRWVWPLAAASAGAAMAVVVMHAGRGNEPVRTAAVAPPAVSAPAVPAPRPDAATTAPAPAPAPAPAKPAPSPTVTASADAPAEPPAPLIRVIREVKIYLYAPSAQRVAVTGDFNGWDAKGVDLKPAGKPGMWEVDLELKPGAYAYNFIVDGDVLVPDPDSPNQMPDGYGGTNSILLVREGAPA
jgi:hypothetical protein